MVLELAVGLLTLEPQLLVVQLLLLLISLVGLEELV
jgi:hypothetical protein